jgi:cytoskeletal protein CcmA (bactofilin family)
MSPRRSIPALAMLLALAASTAHAFQLRLGDGTNALVLAQAESLESESLWIANDLQIDGTADRDLWLLASAAVRFDGESAGDLRILSRSAVVAGLARANLLAYAAGLQLATNSVVRGEAALLGNVVVAEGVVEGDAWIVAQTVTLGGQWGGDVRVQANEILVAPGTRIDGNLVYSAPSAPVLDSTVVVGGDVLPRSDLLPEGTSLSADSLRSRFLFRGYLFVAALMVGLPFVAFFPRLAGGAVRNLQSRPWRALLAGSLSVLAAPFLIAFCAMTLLGIPLAIAIAALYALAAYLSHVVVALWLGHALLRDKGIPTFGRVLAALSVGLLVLYFASAIPGVASFIVLPILVLGVGALVAAQQPPVFAVPIPPDVPFKNPAPPSPPAT